MLNYFKPSYEDYYWTKKALSQQTYLQKVLPGMTIIVIINGLNLAEEDHPPTAPAGRLSRQQSLEESPPTVSYLELNLRVRLQASFAPKNNF